MSMTAPIVLGLRKGEVKEIRLVNNRLILNPLIEDIRTDDVGRPIVVVVKTRGDMLSIPFDKILWIEHAP